MKKETARGKTERKARAGMEVKGQIEMVDIIEDNNNWVIYSKGTEKEAWYYIIS